MTAPFRIIITGSQTFTDYERLTGYCNHILQNRDNVTVICATQKGAGALGIKYAKERGFKLYVEKLDFTAWGGAAITMAYKNMIKLADALVIFWDGEAKTLAMIINMANKKGIPVREVKYEKPKTVKERIEEAETDEVSGKRRKVAIPISKEAKARYMQAHKVWYERKYPQAFKDGLYTAPKFPKIDGPGPLCKFGEDLFNWSGHHMERTANAGVMRNGVWTKGSGTNGTSDCKGHYKNPRYPFAIPVKPEIKWNRDTLSEDQKWYASKMENTGAIACVIKVPEDWVRLLDYLASL